ncbi:hypothetical protein H1R20_g16310, partial [Candolleomyces eurysporus]
MNNLYHEMRHHWEAYRTFQALATQKATLFESSRHFIASYVETLQANQDPFVERLVDKSTLAKLIAEFPNVAYKPKARVASTMQYLDLPPPLEVLPEVAEASSTLGSPFAPIPGINILRRGAQGLNTLHQTPGAGSSSFILRPVFPSPLNPLVASSSPKPLAPPTPIDTIEPPPSTPSAPPPTS